MSRIEGVPPARAGALVRSIYFMARREVGRMTGRHELPGDIPLRAHRPALLLGYGALERAVAHRPRVQERLRALAALKSAVMQGCELCRDIGSQQELAAGVTEEQLIELHRYRQSACFDDAQLVELVNLIAVENLRSRFNAAFGLGSLGFNEGALCARMEHPAAGAAAAEAGGAPDPAAVALGAA